MADKEDSKVIIRISKTSFWNKIKKLRIIFAGILLLIVAALAFIGWHIWHKPPKPVSKPKIVLKAPSPAYTQELANTKYLTATVNSIDISKKMIIVNDGSQQISYPYDSKTLVQSGLAGTAEPISFLKQGMQVNISYDAKTKVLKDIWYVPPTP